MKNLISKITNWMFGMGDAVDDDAPFQYARPMPALRFAAGTSTLKPGRRGHPWDLWLNGDTWIFRIGHDIGEDKYQFVWRARQKAAEQDLLLHAEYIYDEVWMTAFDSQLDLDEYVEARKDWTNMLESIAS